MITADFKDKFQCRLAGMKRIFNGIFQQVERSHQHLIYDVMARDSQLNQANRQTYLINCPISRGNRATHFCHCIKRESVDPGDQIYSSGTQVFNKIASWPIIPGSAPLLWDNRLHSCSKNHLVYASILISSFHSHKRSLFLKQRSFITELIS